MSAIEFVKEIMTENQEQLVKIRELQEILDQLVVRESEKYIFSVTSDM